MSARPWVAWFSPLRPNPSGISDYSEELLPRLLEHWDVDLFVDGYRPSTPLARILPVIDCAITDPIPLLARYDAVVYQVGNGGTHRYACRTLARWPGIVVLHDFSLQHLVLEETLKQGRPDHYVAGMRERYGDAAAERVRLGFHGYEPPLWTVDSLAYPLNEEVLQAATGVIVHSRFLEARVSEARPGLPVRLIQMHAEPPPAGVLADASRPALPGTCVFATVGHITPNKRVDLVLRALSRLRDDLLFEYHLSGDVALPDMLRAQIRQLGLDDRVVAHGPVSRKDLYRRLLEADVGIFLRDPTMGETSAVVMRALSCGRPLVVSNVGWFAELPDEAVAKVAPGPGEEHRLAAVLAELAASPERRAAMGRAARAYANARDPGTRAWEYDDFVRTYGAFPLRTVGRLFRSTAARARELGMEADAAGLAWEAAQHLADLLGLPVGPRLLEAQRGRPRRAGDPPADADSSGDPEPPGEQLC